MQLREFLIIKNIDLRTCFEDFAHSYSESRKLLSFYSGFDGMLREKEETMNMYLEVMEGEVLSDEEQKIYFQAFADTLKWVRRELVKTDKIPRVRLVSYEDLFVNRLRNTELFPKSRNEDYDEAYVDFDGVTD